jgi:hypothetical protein
MATIHIRDIQALLASSGKEDARPDPKQGFFLEIRFDDPDRKKPVVVDDQFKNRVINADSAYGNVIIQFDDQGLLRSIDVS